MDKETVIKILRKQIKSSLTAEYYANALRMYAAIFPGEDMDSIRQIVLEDIQNKTKTMLKQIQSLQF